MIVLGSLIIAISIALGVVMLFGIGMTDGQLPTGWALWSQLWPAYAVFGLGVLVMAAKWLP